MSTLVVGAVLLVVLAVAAVLVWMRYREQPSAEAVEVQPVAPLPPLPPQHVPVSRLTARPERQIPSRYRAKPVDDE